RCGLVRRPLPPRPGGAPRSGGAGPDALAVSRAAVRRARRSVPAARRPGHHRGPRAALERPPPRLPAVAGLRRAYESPLVAHVAGLALLVALLVPHLHLTAHAVVDDEGAYAIQVQQLRHGHWDYHYAGSSFDPKGKWFPIVRADHVGKHYYPYLKHPA